MIFKILKQLHSALILWVLGSVSTPGLKEWPGRGLEEGADTGQKKGERRELQAEGTPGDWRGLGLFLAHILQEETEISLAYLEEGYVLWFSEHLYWVTGTITILYGADFDYLSV